MHVPPCPRCGHSRNSAAKRGEDNLFICSVHGLYDNDPDEGGDFADHRPDIRIEREERRRERHQDQVRNRFNRK